MFYFLILLLLLFFYYIITNHIHVLWKTFLRKGFPKNDDKFGLYVYTGKQGEGKTYSCVRSLIDLKINEGYTIVTNIKSFADTFEDSIYIKNINDIIDFITSHYERNLNTRYIVFFDEIFTVMSKNTKLNYSNDKILEFLAQLRKRSLIFYTTAQEWGEIPLTFRRFCRFQVACHMFNLPILNVALLINKVNDGYGMKWDDDAQDFIAPNISTNILKSNISIIKSYDTFETIGKS